MLTSVEGSSRVLDFLSESENGYANHDSAPVNQLDPIPDTEQEVSSDEEDEQDNAHMNDHYQTYNNHA